MWYLLLKFCYLQTNYCQPSLLISPYLGANSSLRSEKFSLNFSFKDSEIAASHQFTVLGFPLHSLCLYHSSDTLLKIKG